MNAAARLLAALLLLTGATARAEGPDDPRPSDAVPRAPAIPDASFRAVKNRRITVESPGGSVTGKLLGFEADSITLALTDGAIVTLPRAPITSLRLAAVPTEEPVSTPAASEAEPQAEPEVPEKPRYLGIHIGLAPGIMLDVQYSYFYGFASTSPVFPLATSGELFAFTVGGGIAFPLSDHWRFDLFAQVTPLFMRTYYANGLESYVGLGVGAGVHYTSSGGWCFGLKVPLIGAAAGNYYNSYSSSLGTATAYYYLGTALSVAFLSFGYRF